MSWMEVQGHDEVRDLFGRALEQGRLGSTYLFVGPPGIGKRTFALRFAQALLCPRGGATLEPCRLCPSCEQVEAGSHPDLQLVSRPDDRSFIPIELLVGDREHRMREGLCHWIALKPFYAARKVAIIDDADDLNQEGANCLLKTLEEPPPDAVLILISHNLQRQLPTIRSRCQVIHFAPLSKDLLMRLLVQQELAADPEEARWLAAWSDGSLAVARDMSDPVWSEFHQRLLELLAQPNWDPLQAATEFTTFVDQAGTDSPARRARLRIVVKLAADFYRQLLRHSLGVPAEAGEEVPDQVAEVSRRLPAGSERPLACLDRTLEAAEQVDSNAHPATLIATWLDDLWVCWTG